MKLCFLASANSIHSFRWIKYFANKGHEVYWLSLGKDLNPEYRMPKVKFFLIKKFPLKPLRPLFYLSSVKKILKKINPDVFHVHYVWIDGMIGALSGFHPFVLTAWGSDILVAGKNFLAKSLIKFALRKADLITCDAEHMKETIMKLGAKPEKIKIIYFGVDTKKFCPGPKDKELIKKLGIENCPVVISLRNLEPIYDVETLIRAIPLVLKEIPSVKFIIAGKGSEEKKLKNLAKELRISESIRFVGWINHEILPDYLRLGDVYVSTSVSDSTSISLLEAMACGLPSIATNVGDHPRVLKDGENGFIIPVKSPELLSEKIIYLLKNKEIREKIKKFSRETIVRSYNYFREMAKIENIYNELIQMRKG